MFEFPIQHLKEGDEFTPNNGETWVIIRVIKWFKKRKEVRVIDDQNEIHVFEEDKMVIMK